MNRHQHNSIMFAILMVANSVSFGHATSDTMKTINAIVGIVCAVSSLYHWVKSEDK